MAKNITEIDKNLKVETNIDREGLVFKNALDKPFRLYGVFYDGELYRRVPDDIAKGTNDGVYELAKNTAGGRLRFITDSPYLAIKVKLPPTVAFGHMTRTGISGFDIYSYENGRDNVVKSFIPPYDYKDGYELVQDFNDGARERLITLNFPLYNGVYELYIGYKEGSVLKEAPDYKYEKPIVYYGSSITQGGCASRPGMSYQAILTRRYNIDHINLGFSGSGKGEQIMADYIASLDMTAFVLDYDHNSPSVEHYRETHERFYKTVRAAHPDIPIVMMTRPKDTRLFVPSEFERIEIARKTYENAKARGENVYFIEGPELMALAEDEGAVDTVHPTDLGFFSMAQRLSVEFDKFLK